ncbi:RING finger and SPRY domain-containing protein 1 [Rhizopus azygosporus]|uniref:RING finger and SPRY domain-containing protein 1 n=2 Tax=Rhizopus TaxID=4842 RepID=A0A367JQ81_RHIAZ|nr:hypothetical protein G6F69_002367 [Rhizopus microsporus]KAG1232354.1 hypothetical protein G6F67_005068 [Rhizopus microsporus]ORE14023.1 hypothetical protein BCV71DRAFT_229513 [Rhizopus microsporus]RCH92097.1 RING finger and SPRY domain-containing protein 1 [Rhizopus azygosporus]
MADSVASSDDSFYHFTPADEFSLQITHIFKIIDRHWKKLMSISMNHVRVRRPSDEDDHSRQEEEIKRAFYEREKIMLQCMEVLLEAIREGTGFLAFLSVLVLHLRADNPVSLAFMHHVFEKASLPAIDTMDHASEMIISKLNKRPGRLQRMISLLCGRYREAAKKELVRKQLINHWVIDNFMRPIVDPMAVKTRQNAAIVWALLAKKYAGEMACHIWTEEVGDILIKSLANPQEDVLVRLFCLVALERFALTAYCKDRIYHHDLNIHELLLAIIAECNDVLQRIHLLNTGKNQTPTQLDVPLAGPLREEWAKYIQLKSCCQWAVDHTFADPQVVIHSWDLSRLRMIMNPYDATSGLKMTDNGLMLRNDLNHFESVRGTSCVRKGKWYYEVVILTNGIIQIGWASHNSKFSPDEGHAVGDDINSFAFDTFRSAVWVAGKCLYPVSILDTRCAIGDVVGSLLDLDNGRCTYYVNGKLMQMTVEFRCIPGINEHYFGPNGFGLFPAISVHGHQQVRVNFGDEPWIYKPHVNYPYWGISQAGVLDPAYRKKVKYWVYKRGKTRFSNAYCPTGGPILRPPSIIDVVPSHQTPPVSDTSNVDDDNFDDIQSPQSNDGDDDNLCTICYAEPANVRLLPCKHQEIGVSCAAMIKKCHLCRHKITGRCILKTL